MMRAAAFRGQPLLLLGGLLGGWVVLRVALWAPPFDELSPHSLARAVVGSLASVPHDLSGTGVAPGPAHVVANSEHPSPLLRPNLPGPWRTDIAAPTLLPALASPTERVPVQVAVGHNLLLMAGMADMAMPPELAAYMQPGSPQAAPLPFPATPTVRASSPWSADAWLLVRDDSAGPLGPTQPSYGRSQAGAVVRYRLADGGHRPQAYVRGSAALAGPREQEGAVGLSARPLPGLPVSVAAEARVSATAAGTELRPAAFAVTELSAARLPLGARSEAYLQAGWVGGKFATAFVDGQARVDRALARVGDSVISAGAGIWGGAQKGAARLDVGPTARVNFRLGEGEGRVAADYRFRVAGDAQPASGPALTLSAGF